MLRQQSLLTPFGIAKAEYYDLVWVLIGSSTLLLALYSWWVLRSPRYRGDALDTAYAALCRKLAAAGIQRAANEGPTAFAGRLHLFAAPIAALEALIERYAGLRYAHAVPDAAAVREFAAAVGQVRLPRRLAKTNGAPTSS